jgi:hypothetical protein
VRDQCDPLRTSGRLQRGQSAKMAQKVFAIGFFVDTPTAVKYVPLAENTRFPWWDCLPGRVRSLSKYPPSSKPNFVSLEECLNAMVIVEG